MFCANCGTKNEDGAVFCAGCGQKLEAAPAAAPAPAPVEFNGLEDEATVAAYFNPATGTTTPVAPAPVAPEVVAQPVAAAPVAPAPEVVAQPVAAAPVAPAPEVVAQPVAPTPVAPAPEAYAQPVAPTPVAPAPEAYAQPVAPTPVAPAAPAAPAEKKPVNKAVFIIIGAVAAVLVLIIIIVAAVNLGGKSGGAKYTASWNQWFSVEDEVTYLAYGDTVFKETIDGYVSFVIYSMDQSIVVLHNEDEYYMVTNKGKITSLGEDISRVTISADGSTIAYIDEDDALVSYKTSNGTTKKIAEDVTTVVLSPSGKSLAYIVDDDDDYKMYVYDGKKETQLSKNANPIGLTDDCKYIYYYDYNKDALYVTNLKDDSNKIDSDVDGSYVFNKDHTEIMFTTDSGLFVSVKGGDKQKISSKDYMAYYVGLYANYTYYSSANSGALTYNLSSLKGQYYYQGDAIIKIDNKWSADKVINNVYDFSISDDLKTVYYTNDSDTLYFAKLDGKYEATKVKADVTSFSCTRDGKAVYFVVDYDALYYQKGKSDNVKIATDVNRMRVSNDGIVYFIMDYDSSDSTGTLYYSKAGKDKQKVASDVYSIYCDINTVIYYDNYESEEGYDDVTYIYSYSYSYDVNIAKGGTKFKKILEEVGYSYSY